MKKTAANVRPRSSAGKKAAAGRRSGGPSALALPTKARAKKASASIASARASKTSNDVDNSGDRSHALSVKGPKRTTLDDLVTYDYWNFNGKHGLYRQVVQDSVAQSEWVLQAKSWRQMASLLAPVTETKFETKEGAIEYFDKVYAQDGHTGAVSLICPDGSSEDLKLNGIIVDNARPVSESRTKDGFWQIWGFNGPIRSGYSRYPAVVATFDACWRDDPETPDVFAVEHREDDCKPREFWLKRNGRTVI